MSILDPNAPHLVGGLLTGLVGTGVIAWVGRAIAARLMTADRASLAIICAAIGYALGQADGLAHAQGAAAAHGSGIALGSWLTVGICWWRLRHDLRPGEPRHR